MEGYFRFTPFFLTFFLLACGGGSSDNPESSTTQPPPITLNSLDVSMEFTTLFTTGRPVKIQVFGNYSNGSRDNVTTRVSFDVSNPSVGKIEIVENEAIFTPQTRGDTSLTVTMSGQNTNIDISVLNDDIQMTPHALVFPVATTFPFLKNANHYVKANGPAPPIDIFEVIKYTSLDPDIVKFQPSSSTFVIDPALDANFGHLVTLQPGTATLELSYLNYVEHFDIVVGNHKLITTARSEKSFYTAIDTLIDDQANSWFLSGVRQWNQYFKISQYSASSNEWLPDLLVDTNKDFEMARGLKLLVTNEKIYVSWFFVSEQESYIAEIDRQSSSQAIYKLDGIPRIGGIGLDNNDRLFLCWSADTQQNAKCRIRLSEQQWSNDIDLSFPLKGRLYDEVNATTHFTVTSNNEFFVVTQIVGENNVDIIGKRLRIENENIFESSEALLDTSMLENRLDHFCDDIVVTSNGNMACSYVEINEAGNKLLYTVRFTPESGWSTRLMLAESDEQIASLPAIRPAASSINERGDGIIIWADTTALDLKYSTFDSLNGWSDPIPIEDYSLATPYLGRSALYTNDGWKVFLEHNASIMTISGDSTSFASITGMIPLVEDPYDFDKSLGLQTDAKTFIAKDGEFAVLWESVWQTFDVEGLKFNSLFFAQPKQK